jgi:NADP-dependent 3-hydroxy acid dehydrogenase YdfG
MKEYNSTSLAGRVVVITGASSGIGEATAQLLAAKGAKVALLARREDKLKAIETEINEAGGDAKSWIADVTNKSAVDAAAKEIIEYFGQVDIVVNNAGVMLPNPIEELKTDQWQRQIDLNNSGLMNIIGAFTPALIEAGKRNVADLVNISSIAGKNLYPNFAVYSATKAFVTHLSIHLRAELGPKGVRVSAIEPGIVGTELQSHVDYQGALDWLSDAKEQMEWLTPEDIASAIAYLVSAPKRVNLQQVTILPTGQAS